MCAEHNCTFVMISSQHVEHAHSLEDLAVLRHPTLLLGCVFRGWCRVTREERVRTWEQERRAKRHHERCGELVTSFLKLHYIFTLVHVYSAKPCLELQ